MLESEADARIDGKSPEPIDNSHFNHILGDFRTIVIVPAQEPSTVALAHQLRPRFLTYANSDFVDLVAVLQKMIESDRRDGAKGDKTAV